MQQFSTQALADVRLRPFWLDRTDAPQPCPPLSSHRRIGLLVVGGGFTGLWGAIQAKQRRPEVDVILIEKNTVAYGASGRPGGIVSTSVMHGLSNAVRIFPNDIAHLEQLGQENIREFMRTVDEHGIDCHAEWGGELTVALDDESAAALHEEHELHVKYGHDAVLLDRDAVRQQVNSPRYVAGVWSKHACGTVHPALLAWGLKRAALSLGVVIYEDTALLHLEDQGGTVKATTARGSVTADRVLLATNAFVAGHKKIKWRVAAVRDRVLATEPLSQTQMDLIGWRSRQGVYDMRTQMNYMRLTKDNRIIFGGRLGYTFAGEPFPPVDMKVETYKPLADAFFETFPQLAGVRFTNAWSGPIDLSTRMAVHFQRYYGEKVVYVGGYSGFGVSASRFGAGIALDILGGSRTPASQLDFATQLPGMIPPEPFRWIGAKLTMHALDTADKKGGWRKPWLRMVSAMGFPLS